jgi:hypothetical protein
MNDAADVMAVLGALDHEVARLEGEARETARARVAELIPPYAEPDAVGWYDRLVDAGGGAGPPDLDRALERLARPPADDHAVPLRVAALGSAARAFPEAYGPRGAKRDVMLRALAVPGILTSPPAGDRAPDAERGLRLLAEPPAGDRSFSGLRAAGRGLLDDPLLRKRGPFAVKLPPDGGIDLRSRLRVRGLTLDDARRGMLDPARWKEVDGWCDMVPSAARPPEPGVEQFLEEVAMGDCKAGGLKIAVWLDFFPIAEFVDHKGVELTLGYTMSNEQPPPANGLVVKDEGEVSVLDEGDHLTVRTRKVLKATIPGLKSVPSLAYSLGYLGLAARFIVQTSSGLSNEITIEEVA